LSGDGVPKEVLLNHMEATVDFLHCKYLKLNKNILNLLVEELQSDNEQLFKIRGRRWDAIHKELDINSLVFILQLSLAIGDFLGARKLRIILYNKLSLEKNVFNKLRYHQHYFSYLLETKTRLSKVDWVLIFFLDYIIYSKHNTAYSLEFSAKFYNNLFVMSKGGLTILPDKKTGLRNLVEDKKVAIVGSGPKSQEYYEEISDFELVFRTNFIPSESNQESSNERVRNLVVYFGEEFLAKIMSDFSCESMDVTACRTAMHASEI
jgi:hypothetical protein